MTETITSTVVTSYTYDDANRLTHVDGNPLTWDERGNLLVDQDGTVYTYNAANRLIRADKDSVTYKFDYNGLGDRLSQTVNDHVTTYTLDIASNLTQVLYDGTNSYLYPSTEFSASGLGRIGEKQPNGWAYHLTDGLGSVRQLVNSDAYIVLAQSFEPFGDLMVSEGDASSIYGFTGEQVDGTGLVYLRARYYAPSFNRFLSADTFAPDLWNPQTLNRYAYVSNNPILYIDPTGHWVDTVFDFAAIGFDLNDICQNGLTFLSGAALAVDVFFVIIPGLTGGGAAIRAANRAEDVIDAGKNADIIGDAIARSDELSEAILRSDDVNDLSKAVNNVIEEPWGNNYRKNYDDLYQIKRNTLEFQVHHMLPQQFREILEKVGINVDDPEILREVLKYDPITETWIHQSLYTDVWEFWKKNLGHTPEPEEIIKKAKKLEEQYIIEGTLFYREGANLPGLVNWDKIWQIYKGNK
jgi:RHS repeat-associated protein